MKNKMCDCGFPQSFPNPHEHSLPDQKTFTNDDLKLLKNYLLTDRTEIVLNVEAGYALITRLEAAEKVCDWLTLGAGTSALTESNLPLDKMLKEWCKSAGR